MKGIYYVPRWRAALWRVIEPLLTGKVRGYLGAAILEGRLYSPVAGGPRDGGGRPQQPDQEKP